MKPIVCILFVGAMLGLTASAQAQSLPSLPTAAVPTGCLPTHWDVDLCGAGGNDCVVHSPRPVAMGMAQSGARIKTGPSGLVLQADHMLFSKASGVWDWSPVPEREGTLHGNRTGLWFARSTSPVPTLRFAKGDTWTKAAASPDNKTGWTFHDAGCPMAVRTSQAQEGGQIRTQVEVSFWTGHWSSIWRAGFSGAGPVRVFPGRKGLHVFFQSGGPKGHTLFYGVSGGAMKPLIGPTENDGKPFQLSGQGLWFAETDAGLAVVVEALAGIRHLDMGTGKFTWIARNIEMRKTTKDIQTETWQRAHGVALLPTKRGTRFIHTLIGGSRAQRVAQSSPGSRMRPPPPQVLESEAWRLNKLVDLDALSRPFQIPGNEPILSAAIGPQGHIQLARVVYGGSPDQRMDLYSQTLSVQKTLGRPGRKHLLDVRQTRTERLDLDMSSEQAFFEAGFHRWGLGSTTFRDGVARLTTPSYEEWMPTTAQGLLKDKAEAWVLEARVRVVSQDVKYGTPQPGQVNAGMRISGPGQRVLFQFSRAGLIFTFNGQHFRREGLDVDRFHTYKIEVQGNTAVLSMDGVVLSTLKGEQKLITDRVWLTFGALGGNVESTTEWDHLRLEAR